MRIIHSSKITTATLLAALAFAPTAWAQMDNGGGPTAPPMPMGGQTMPGTGPMGGTPQGARPGGNPFTGRMPFTAGTISAVDAAGGTVTLTPMFAGMKAQTVQISDATQITTQADVKVMDLKVGDTVQVRGVPTGITATQITAGDSPEAPMGPAVSGMRPGGIAGGGKPGLGSAADYAQASGKITSLSPLTIALSDSVQVTLKVTAATTVRKYLTEKIGALKVGDRIMANGQTGDDGVFHATRLRVNGAYGVGKRQEIQP